jgi:predicted dehydrogenase
MANLRFAIFGAGFWTPYQLSAWRELPGVECVAIYNRTPEKARAIADKFGIPAVYDDPEKLLREIRPDFVDNITELGGHKPLSLLCARHRIPCICQKPLAPTLEDAREMVTAFARAKTPFYVHENWRWQTPVQALRDILASGLIGTPFRARLTMTSGFPCWLNQPALATADRFILMDLGVHILDTARVLFGEAGSLYCQTRRTLAPRVAGENVASLLLSMGDAGTIVSIEMAYAGTPLEPGVRECFPETLAFVEGPLGSVELSAGYILRVTTCEGTRVTRHAPPRYGWADPAYEVAHASIVPCNASLLAALRQEIATPATPTVPTATPATRTATTENSAVTSGEDNLKTLELVTAAYHSSATGHPVHLNPRRAGDS